MGYSKYYYKLKVDLEMNSIFNISRTLTLMFPDIFELDIFTEDSLYDTVNFPCSRETMIYWGLKLIAMPMLQYNYIFSYGVKDLVSEFLANPSELVNLELSEDEAKELATLYLTPLGKIRHEHAVLESQGLLY